MYSGLTSFPLTKKDFSNSGGTIIVFSEVSAVKTNPDKSTFDISNATDINIQKDAL